MLFANLSIVSLHFVNFFIDRFAGRIYNQSKQRR
nr:MAG TPA: hypothetical protein [Caudoviricetes sp.]